MNHLEIINKFIGSLPTYIDTDGVPEDICCPICLLSFKEILEDAPLAGVTMLPSCQHFFCRHELSEWIRGMYGSCPTCRHVFLDIRPPSGSNGVFNGDEEDEEEVDDHGGEYSPNENEEVEEEVEEWVAYDEDEEGAEEEVDIHSGDLLGEEEYIDESEETMNLTVVDIFQTKRNLTEMTKKRSISLVVNILQTKSDMAKKTKKTKKSVMPTVVNIFQTRRMRKRRLMSTVVNISTMRWNMTKRKKRRES
ncbi:hypothetical protein GGU11DRAFT_204590 [Lentinula aff. detonsa]|uniref:RING-type domain-containing protein n=1 Tax=Lentinula aff. detonsa TaxID=2804958 RepID=A0AA38NQ60_9AGAR|nr:hypothetical protein GGU10DRAFT_111505 [Lentinula aff. detonsa]KAJ3801589.1 hypothetical protein GGU11DRAFT_204590 [Lentinula aff. detonsa]